MNMTEYAKSFIGTPYIYRANGGDSFDCSSYMTELLKAFGHLKSILRDYYSQSLYNELIVTKNLIAAPDEDTVLFFGKDVNSITHVALAINRWQMIEAGGGDSTTQDFEDARRDGAMVRIRPIENRRDLVAVICLL